MQKESADSRAQQRLSKGYDEVLPGLLYLGPEMHLPQALSDVSAICHVIRCMDLPPTQSFLASLPRPVHIVHLPISEGTNYDIAQHFSVVFDVVEAAKVANEAVYVHCAAGANRSPSICMSYMMRSLRLRCTESLEMISAQRPIVSPDESFLRQLCELEMEIFGDVAFDVAPIRIARLRATCPFASCVDVQKALQKANGDLNAAADALFDAMFEEKFREMHAQKESLALHGNGGN